MLTNEKYRAQIRTGRPWEGDTWTFFYSPPPLQLIFRIGCKFSSLLRIFLYHIDIFLAALVTMEEKLRSRLFGEVCK